VIHEKFDELKLTGNLPSPSGVGLKILQLSQSEDYSLDELTDVIRVDPALTGRIIKVANSAVFATGEAATSVAGAAMRLGMQKVRAVALGFTLVSGNRTGNCPGFDYERYWSRSLAFAVAAQVVARHIPRWDPVEGFTCGLLSRIGKLALAAVHPEAYSEILQTVAPNDSEALIKEETRTFDINHLEVSGAMMEDWGLPEGFMSGVLALQARIDEPDEDMEEVGCMADLLRAADALAGLCVSGDEFSSPSWRADNECLARLTGELEISAEALDEICNDINDEWPRWGELLEIATKAMRSESERGGAGAGRPAASSASKSAGAVDVLEEEAPVGRTLVLAVDDDPKQLRLLSHHLRKKGYEVITAENGEDALKKTVEFNPQIVVTDWMMPGMNGLELCKVLRKTESGRSLYVLILTAREDEERIVEAFNAGADDYVSKPFTTKILLARVSAGQRLIKLQSQVDSDKLNRMKQVAEMGRLTRKLRTAALTDVLTELPNRRYAMKRLEQEWENAQRSNRPLSVIMVDIDFFKKVNDVYGHDIGDVVLRETAHVLRAKTRRGDVVCRLGGEEFLVININCSLGTAGVCSERLRVAVEGNTMQSGNYDSGVTVSLGVAEMDESMQNIDDLLKAADEAAYAAKAAGRNCSIKSEKGATRKTA
jgi:two-component system cell cycle response regulator